MKQFKTADFWISVSLVILALIALPFKPEIAFFIAYFGIGCWHCIGMFIHFIFKWFMQKKYARSNYHWVVVTILLIAALGLLLQEILWFLAFVMLFAAPIMVLIYTNICYTELQKMKRPLDLLK